MIYRPFCQYSRVDPKSKRKSVSDLELETTLAKQKGDFWLTAKERQKEIKALTASFKQQASQIQKLSAQVATVSPRRATQVVDNNQ
jgi:Ca2+-dependent lipid-binding protein